jgi:hypothetical protein
MPEHLSFYYVGLSQMVIVRNRSPQQVAEVSRALDHICPDLCETFLNQNQGSFEYAFVAIDRYHGF